MITGRNVRLFGGLVLSAAILYSLSAMLIGIKLTDVWGLVSLLLFVLLIRKD